MSKTNWPKYAFEFLSIFLAVISAFALNNWNDKRKNDLAESKILTEISKGLEMDVKDVQQNVFGHEFGLKSSQYWRKVIKNEAVNFDSIQIYYSILLRDFICIQNTSGYENLKSRGLELIKNDSLRTSIISLYEYDFKTLRTLEEDYSEMQFNEIYYKEINDYLAPHFQYDSMGNIIGITMPLELSEGDKNRFLSYLYRIDHNRKFTLGYYQQIIKNINELKKKIDREVSE